MSSVIELKAKALTLFSNGSFVRDLECNEVFKFNVDQDYYVVAENPKRFRLATEEEKQTLIESGQNVIEV